MRINHLNLSLQLLEWNDVRDTLKAREFNLNPHEIPTMMKDNWKEVQMIVLDKMEERDLGTLSILISFLQEIFYNGGMNPELLGFMTWDDWEAWEDWTEVIRSEGEVADQILRQGWDKLNEEGRSKFFADFQKLLKEIHAEALYTLKNSFKEMFNEEGMNPELLDFLDWASFGYVLRWGKCQLDPDEIPAIVRKNWKERKKQIMADLGEIDAEVLYILKTSFIKILNEKNR